MFYKIGCRSALTKLGFNMNHLIHAGVGAGAGALLGGENNRMSGALGGAALGLSAGHVLNGGSVGRIGLKPRGAQTPRTMRSSIEGAAAARPTPSIAPEAVARPTPSIAPEAVARPTPSVRPEAVARPTPSVRPEAVARPTPSIAPEPLPNRAAGEYPPAMTQPPMRATDMPNRAAGEYPPAMTQPPMRAISDARPMSGRATVDSSMARYDKAELESMLARPMPVNPYAARIQQSAGVDLARPRTVRPPVDRMARYDKAELDSMLARPMPVRPHADRMSQSEISELDSMLARPMPAPHEDPFASMLPTALRPIPRAPRMPSDLVPTMPVPPRSSGIRPPYADMTA